MTEDEMRALLDVLAWDAVLPSSLDRTWSERASLAWDADLDPATLRECCGQPVFG